MVPMQKKPRWLFQIFFIFTPILREMIQFDEHIFQMGWNHQLETLWNLEVDIHKNPTAGSGRGFFPGKFNTPAGDSSRDLLVPKLVA